MTASVSAAWSNFREACSASLVMRSGRLLERREGIMPNGSTAAGREPVRRPRRCSWVLRARFLSAHPTRKLYLKIRTSSNVRRCS